ncbi:tetratricopeptide repeat-containing sulfotransferase family protein [Pseudoxanthomonas dokdonensis]|uniref:Uncharacterized protein n=1 Tax=Pseudoxanthomonas dokdonensis TaxID=344882 RepID=A0A0R0CGG5_9GAMM|nr:sulfotransferase [Pseudoxanthomonas dokdonensis]KRG68924.1 hypothetical protein ABB29_10680 [Pseudoxanthomonas dokdonensis]
MTSSQSRFLAAATALNGGQWSEAWRISSLALTDFPDHDGLHFVAGVASRHLGDSERACLHLSHAAQLQPARADYVAHLAAALAADHRLPDALREADRAVSLGAADRRSLELLGHIYNQANAIEQSVAIFQRAVELFPGDAGLRFHLAEGWTYLGDNDKAEREYGHCLRLQPSHWPAYLARSRLRKQSLDRNHLAEMMLRLRQAEGDQLAALYLNTALYKELEDLGQFSRAFWHLSAGKRAWKTRLGYRSEQDQAIFNKLQSFPFDRHATSGCESAEPVFVFGMPRTGTTLVERIISSHGHVTPVGERNSFLVAMSRQLAMPPGSLSTLLDSLASNPLDWRALGQHYLEETRPAQGTMRFLDKLPHNFMYAGFIAKAFPNARMICLRRDPMDTCLANFSQVFSLESPNYDYSFDILDTGSYYLMFDALMAHWQRSFPGRILEVSYEDLVQRQEETTRMLLEHCGLEWQQACLEFERNPHAVTTASAVQVRSPIYRSSLQRWKRYETELEPLRELLGDKVSHRHSH